jgi:hypothetical protein
MSDDLYTQPTPTIDPTTTTQLVSPSSPYDFFGLDYGQILHFLNLYILAATIIFSIILTMDFFFYRVKFNEMAYAREEQGVRSLKNAINMWWTYLFCLTLFAVYTLTNPTHQPLVAYVAIFSYFCKFVLADIPVYPFWGKLLGAPGSKIGDLLNSTFQEGQKLVGEFVSTTIKFFTE